MIKLLLIFFLLGFLIFVNIIFIICYLWDEKTENDNIHKPFYTNDLRSNEYGNHYSEKDDQKKKKDSKRDDEEDSSDEEESDDKKHSDHEKSNDSDNQGYYNHKEDSNQDYSASNDGYGYYNKKSTHYPQLALSSYSSSASRSSNNYQRAGQYSANYHQTSY